MDLKEQIIKEYLEQGCGYRKLQSKYGISRTTICKWVQIYQGIHGMERTQKQQNHFSRPGVWFNQPPDSEYLNPEVHCVRPRAYIK